MIQLLAKVGINGFFFALLGMIVLAYFFPSFGTEQSPLHLPDIAEYGVSIIFFFYGLKLNPEKLKSGLSNWKLHLVIQLTTFVLFPFIILGIGKAFNLDTSSLKWLGIFYLATLPSTVSSSVVMVAIAGGNIPAAIFNASISSIIGIFITPLWMSRLLEKQDADFDISSIILRLCLEVLLPVILGFFLHKKWGKWTERYNGTLRIFDQVIILLIVYTSFCESFANNMFSDQSLGEIVALGFWMLLFFAVMFGIMFLVSRWFGFNRPDTITVLFCGSKKSLVQGAVMGKVLFPNAVTLGVVLLPLMIYHALQLLVGSMIAQQMGKKEVV
ncbi:bile acid:sodium symporter [Runella sp. CRIBMP]|uniref:bile acid:sodium symporter family protein n=1 Tax=Runella sp. CRIBMP TaxID=2683261 RepID=UPI0014127E28|nr:bile acid:sodium symporter family protein [Runella sp. CRIBMP]NBB19873.1 bile acid:sodium symporter [Runella sp. CRIBMP]